MTKPTKADAPEAAALLGRKGGLARAKNMTKEQLREAGRKAITARWAKRPKPPKS